MITSSELTRAPTVLRARPAVVADTISLALALQGLVGSLLPSKPGERLVMQVRAGNGVSMHIGTIWIDTDGSFWSDGRGFIDSTAVESALARLFDPGSARACNIQLRRLTIRGEALQGPRIDYHPGDGARFAVRLDPADRLPTWTPVRGEGLLHALLGAGAPMSLAVFRRLMIDLTALEPPVLDGYTEADQRWRHAEPINRELRRLGLLLRAAPGTAGAIDRVPIHVCQIVRDGETTDLRLESMPAWRLPWAEVYGLLADMPKGRAQADVVGVLDAMQGERVDLTDWRAGTY